MESVGAFVSLWLIPLDALVKWIYNLIIALVDPELTGYYSLAERLSYLTVALEGSELTRWYLKAGLDVVASLDSS